MARPEFLSVLLLSILCQGRCQNNSTTAGPSSTTTQPECAFKDGFVPGTEECCSNYVYTYITKICCTDAETNRCFCDGNNYPVCAAVAPAPPPSPYLCPGLPVPKRRLLGSSPVDDSCSARGVVGLNVAGSQFCNAAYVNHPSSGERQLYTLSSCWRDLESACIRGLATTGTIYRESFPLDNCTVRNVSQTDNEDVTVITLSLLAAFFVEKHINTCDSPGCVYTASTMRNAIDLENCFIVSYGFTSSGTSSLSRVPVKVADVTRCSNSVPRSQCFVSTTGGSSCLGDGGAPVYCNLRTEEVALYGIAYFPPKCSHADTSFTVIPISV